MKAMSKWEMQHQARIVQETLREDYNTPIYAAEMVEHLLYGAGCAMSKHGIEVIAMYIVQGGQEVILQTHMKKWCIPVPASVFECRDEELTKLTSA